MDLFRFLGFRKLAALLAVWPIAMACRLLLAGEPPANYSEWTATARASFANLVSGFYTIEFAVWLAAVTEIVVWIKRRWLASVAHGARMSLVAWFLVPGMVALVDGAIGMNRAPTEHFLSAGWPFVRVAALPVLIGVIPLGMIDLYERLRTIRTLHRWRTSGRGVHAGWISPYALWKHSRRLPGRRLW